MGDRDFFLITGNDEITFQVGDAGRTTGLVLYGSGKAQGGGQRAVRIGS